MATRQTGQSATANPANANPPPTNPDAGDANPSPTGDAGNPATTNPLTNDPLTGDPLTNDPLVQEYQVLKLLQVLVRDLPAIIRESERKVNEQETKREQARLLLQELGITINLPPVREDEALDTLQSADTIILTVRAGTQITRVTVDGGGTRLSEELPSLPSHSPPTSTRRSRGQIPPELTGVRIRVRGKPHSETTASAAIEQFGSLAKWLADIQGWTSANIYGGYIEYLSPIGWTRFER